MAELRILVGTMTGTAEAVANDIEQAGNTSSASIPLAFHRLVAEGAARPGDTALLLAFGGGLAFAAQIVKVPQVGAYSQPQVEG